MKNKKLFQKIVFIALIALILFSLVAPAIFSQMPPAPKQEKLLNGLKVLMWPDARSDKVSVSIRIHAGAAFDPQGKEGVMQMLADNIFPNEAAREFFTDDLGGTLEVVTTYDFIQINASSKPIEFLSMLETLAAAVSNPTIDKETTARLRTALAARATTLQTDAGYVADRAVAKRLLGTYPYGRPAMGTPDSIKTIDFADLIDAKGRFLTADNATIGVTGNFDKSLGARAIRRYFGGWLKADKHVPATFRQPDAPPTGLQVIRSPEVKAVAMRFALRGVARNDKNLAASHIFAQVLESRLKGRVRGDMAPRVFVKSDAHILPGVITIGLAEYDGRVSDEKTTAEELVRKSLAEPVTDAEFSAARGRFAAWWQSQTPVSLWLDMDTFRTAAVDDQAKTVDAVTLHDVTTFAEKLQKAPMVMVLVSGSTTSD